MRSGDVEKNPGPLSPEQIAKIDKFVEELTQSTAAELQRTHKEEMANMANKYRALHDDYTH